jgi:hypothetical protein
VCECVCVCVCERVCVNVCVCGWVGISKGFVKNLEYDNKILFLTTQLKFSRMLQEV